MGDDSERVRWFLVRDDNRIRGEAMSDTRSMEDRGYAKAALAPYTPPYEDTASLEYCRCRQPVRDRSYLRVWTCRCCSKPIRERAA